VPEARTIKIIVKAPNHNTTLLNQALVDPENLIPEGDELNNSATATTIVQSVINLTIHKDGPTESEQSQVSKYTIKIENKAPDSGTGQDAFDVEMTDPLPVGLIPLAVTADQNFACSVAENPINLVNCVGDLGTGQTATITVDVFMTAEGGRSLDNQACVDPADKIEEFNENDNCSTASTLTGVDQPKLKPDLVVVKSVSPSGPVTAGQSLTYTVSIVNGGTAKAKGPLTLTDTMPAHVTFINYTATNGWTCAFAAPKLTCHEPAAPDDGLEAGASATITIEATYEGDATSPLVNVAKADKAFVDPAADDTHEDETNLDNNTGTAKNSVGSTGIDLVVAAITDNPDPVDRGQSLTYVAVVVNGGTQDTTSTGKQVVVKFDAPQNGATYTSGAGSNGFNCDATVNVNHEIFCKGDLPAGGDTTITLKFAVLLGAPDDLVLKATVDPNSEITESNEGNNTAEETTTVTGQTCQGLACVDLVAAQVTGSPEPYPNNGTVTFSYVLVNVGDTATALDPDPTHGQRLTHFDVSGAFASFTRTITPTNPASVITCQNDPASVPNASVLSNCFGNLGAGEGVIITIKLTGVTSNTATASALADPFGLIPELVENNNSASKTVHKQ